MSTIEQTINPTKGKIPLTRRIAELMQEKGDGFTIRGFATRLGISREYLRLMLSGERNLSPAMLEKIAQGLGVSLERLHQLDTAKSQMELSKLLDRHRRTKVMLMQALDLATVIVKLARGATERGFALNNLGRVQFLQAKYDEAHGTWSRALVYAQQLHAQFDEKHLLHLVTANLMLTSTIRKEYSNIEEILQVVEQAFPDNSQVMGISFYTRMKMQEDRGDMKQAKEHAYRSLEFFEQTNNGNHIGKALYNAAYYEYILGNYEKSAKLLSSALKHVLPYEDVLVQVVKNYVKSLMKLRDYDTAIQVVEEYTEVVKEYPEYAAKLKIMYSVAVDDPSYAESVINDATLSASVRYIASKCLTEYYYLKGDAVTAMRYYEKVRIYSSTKSEYLDEEEL
ncbi:helix-turn-helix domain-containing protein [Tumebacillus permanentifrigoris]|uniref:Helix-turn-helix protein n=1 Tax=Tumebacillus permanentifrigoris TaxID=378543 RepID=A0A316DDU3_9BACL|nr:helix-turn-helix transcriptional regulator [Tumebacillus permanentifrigoris]PWK16145.1 helix-turn-helix protein [Tumebacillus permanentifrigoris]